MYRQEISLMLFSFNDSKTDSSISVFAENNTSPVSVLNISLDKTLPNRNSSERDIWDAFELVNSLILSTNVENVIAKKNVLPLFLVVQSSE